MTLPELSAKISGAIAGKVKPLLNGKVDKVPGKGLSANDYTTEEKNKLSGIAANATSNAAATAAPLMDGSASVGTSAKYAREDHRHPVDASRASADDVEAIKTLLRNAVLYRTASGNPATFDDGAAANVKALSVTITPTQSGSGDPSPSNVRPISGVSSVTVTRTGKNLFPVRNASFTTRQFVNFSPALPAGTYTLSAVVETSDTDNSLSLALFNGNKYIFLGRGTRASKILTSDVPVRNVELYASVDYRSSAEDAATWSNMQLEAGDTATPFEAPYQAQTVTVTLTDGSNPLTVYGGTLDVTTGTLSVTWANIASYNGETLPGVWMSDRDVYAAGTSPTTGAQVVYELAAPVAYQLTPQQLATLAGCNAVATDAGSVAVEYRADVALSLEALESNLTNALLSLGTGF